MRPPPGFTAVESRGHRALLRTDLVDAPLDALWQAGESLPGAKGRGGVCVLRLPGELQAVARDYRRGGVLRRLLGDRYSSPGRAFAELSVLAALRDAGVPVVEPLAAVARRHGPFWRLRLVTALVPGADPLPAFVAAEPELRRAAVVAAAQAVARAFAAGLDHPDFHPDNLLARRVDGAVHVLLLDLDRARLRPELTAAARDRMLVRMARYMIKHAASLAAGPTTVDLLRFLRGLGLEQRAQRRAELVRLGAALRRAVARRRWRWA